jgi:hypothetical protein
LSTGFDLGSSCLVLVFILNLSFITFCIQYGFNVTFLSLVFRLFILLETNNSAKWQWLRNKSLHKSQRPTLIYI